MVKRGMAQRAASRLVTRRLVLKERGILGSFGYSKVASLTQSQRRAALHAAAAARGWQYIYKRLNVLYIFNKYRNPALAAAFRADRDYARAAGK